MQTELVSIMMPAYNAEPYIGQAIESALAQTYTNWELIIVNDGSKDRTPEIAAQYTDPRIRLLHQPNGGEAVARNTALKHMRGEYVAFLDSDDAFLPKHLELVIGYFWAHPDRDGVYSDGYYCDQDGKIIKPLSSRRRGPFEGDIFEEVVRSSDVFGAPVCVVLRRDLIVKHALEFDPQIVIGPDWDFLTQFATFGQFGYINQQTCLYRVHQTNISLRTGLEKRALHLAKCREKAIKMGRFKTCSVETRAFVFYDLLINLLKGDPERQAAVTQWAEFMDLLADNRAKLFRWMASKALLRGEKHAYIKEWLSLSMKSYPKDPITVALYVLYRIHPWFCKLLLGLRGLPQAESQNLPPFADLLQANSPTKR